MPKLEVNKKKKLNFNNFIDYFLLWLLCVKRTEIEIHWFVKKKFTAYTYIIVVMLLSIWSRYTVNISIKSKKGLFTLDSNSLNWSTMLAEEWTASQSIDRVYYHSGVHHWKFDQLHYYRLYMWAVHFISSDLCVKFDLTM